ncbi:hypothetical protein FACS1894177_06640 [Bacteroidia bacterium]|nr:hypothetical protein FACS1894177_06640 [Bacteroidia bacterium]
MKQKNDYLWKGILEDVFDDFLRFMHPNADEIFDFSKGIVFLDKELEQLFPPETEDEYAIKIVDKLAKVYTREGEEEWVLIHCEVQAKYSVDFPRRMFTYFYRILDKYNKRISAYAILTENNTKSRPDRFEMEFLDTKQVYHYKVYKIAQQGEEELLRSNNPFAMVALTARSVFVEKNLGNTQERDAALMEVKLKLSRKFLSMALPKEKIRMIMNFLRNYLHFENPENSITFETNLEHITGRKQTMGIEELILTTERKHAEKRGENRTQRKMIFNMIRKSLDDSLIADVAEVPLDYVRKVRASLKKD